MCVELQVLERHTIVDCAALALSLDPDGLHQHPQSLRHMITQADVQTAIGILQSRADVDVSMAMTKASQEIAGWNELHPLRLAFVISHILDQLRPYRGEFGPSTVLYDFAAHLLNNKERNLDRKNAVIVKKTDELSNLTNALTLEKAQRSSAEDRLEETHHMHLEASEELASIRSEIHKAQTAVQQAYKEATEAEANLKSVLQRLECPICSDTVNQVTDCGHAICTPCLARLLEVHAEASNMDLIVLDEFHCPICRKLVKSWKVTRVYLFD